MSTLSKVLVTGGAGFIGSHVVDHLMQIGLFVRVVDNLSSGNLDNVKRWLDSPRFEFVDGDLKNMEITEKAVDEVDTVFHFAANPEVRVAEVDPSLHFYENLLATFHVLDAMRKSKTAKLIVFPSSSTIYGEPTEFPTAENYGPLLPISVYGASKLGCEALISSYCHTFGIGGLIFRLANIVGDRSTHGVIFDFVRKLQKHSKALKILGDGNQTKAYLHVSDCVDAFLHTLRHFLDQKKTLDVYNVGPLDKISVKHIAEIVSEEMGLKDLQFEFTGGVDGGRGWKGDVMVMLLSINRLLSIGWRPKFSSEEAVRLTCRELLQSSGKH